MLAWEAELCAEAWSEDGGRSLYVLLSRVSVISDKRGPGAAPVRGQPANIALGQMEDLIKVGDMEPEDEKRFWGSAFDAMSSFLQVEWVSSPHRKVHLPVCFAAAHLMEDIFVWFKKFVMMNECCSL